jgi:hypothetical protein
METATTPRCHSTGDLLRMYGWPSRAIRRIFERGLLPDPPGVGPYRMIPVDEIGRLKSALEAAGYVKSEPEATP